MFDNDVLFLGGVFLKEDINQILSNSKTGVQMAADKLQWSIIKGLDCNLNKKVKILSSIFVGSYPKKYKKLFIKSKIFFHSNDHQDNQIGFLNIPLLKNFSKVSKIKPILKKWLLDGNLNKMIICYSMTYVSMAIISYVKKINKKTKTCLFVPDLPEFMNTSIDSFFLYKTLKKIEIQYINNRKKNVDKFIVLTEQMAEKLAINNYFVIEGMVNLEDELPKIEKSDFKTIVYCGTLNQKYGIKNLIDAFNLISKENDHYKLCICGDGDSKGYVVHSAKYNDNIKYYGVLNHQEILVLENEASVLINPRQNNETFTKYSFPSKMMEYLLVGKPIVCYQLDGYTKEYDDYFIYCKDNSVETLAKVIIETLNLSEEQIENIRKKNRKFVLEEKNNIVQCKRLLEFCND